MIEESFRKIGSQIHHYLLTNGYNFKFFIPGCKILRCDYFELSLNTLNEYIDVSFCILNKQKDTAVLSLLIQFLFVSEKSYVNYKIRILDDIHISYVENDIKNKVVKNEIYVKNDYIQ